MRAAVSDRAGEIGGGEVRAGQVGFQISRVTGAALVVEEGWDDWRLANFCKVIYPGGAVRYQDLGIYGDRDTYSFPLGRFCTTRM